ncbi:MAG: sulfotransferase [Coleofasciculus chthonoplastes F3-SA18-01]|uniref:sulfotransferase family protein n=1 Tax=Coleofasciculus chthonoplastes TaxID=64178 RepID=UPI0033025829
MPLITAIRSFLKHPQAIPKNIFMRLPKTISSDPHIFVFGAPRSGTTLMKLILGAHPNLSSFGYETGLFMYRDIYGFTYEGFTATDIANLINQSPDIVRFYDKFTQQITQQTGGQRFIEKTPQHVLRLKFLLKHFPNAKFINMFRDGRDGYCSARHHQNVPQGKSIVRYASYWKKCVNVRLRQGENDKIFDVKYEELTTNPEQVVRQIMNFLGEEYDARQIEPQYYSQNRITQDTRQEFRKLSKSIDQSSQERWKKELIESEVQQFHKIAGRELQILGYMEDRLKVDKAHLLNSH